MNRLLVAAGLVFALGAVAVYAIYAARVKKKPDLALAVHIGMAGAAIPGGIIVLSVRF